MTRIRVRRLAENPRRRVRRVKANKRRRRNLSTAQIKAGFGGKRRQVALKQKRRRHNPKGYGWGKSPARAAETQSRGAARWKSRKRNTRNRKRSRNVRNPALALTLGPALNPRKRRKSNMAKANERRRRRASINPRRHRRRASAAPRRRRRVSVNPRRHRRRNRRNPAPRVVVRYRNRRRRSNRHHRRNPMPTSVFGIRLTIRSVPILVGGGLAGVAVTKFLPTLVPASMQIGGNAGRAAFSLIAAFVGGWAGSLANPEFGGAMLFGGLMQFGSVVLNAFLPGFALPYVGPLALSGMGELVPGRFAVPQNPIRQQHVPAQARVTMNGLSRAYGTAW